MRRVQARAIHIGADALAWPGHAHMSVLRGCRDTLTRMMRLARAAGIQEQRCLAGTQATCAAVAETIACEATALAPDGLLVVTFSGHTEWKHDQTFWCLHDGEIPLGEMAACLAGAAASACIVVVADTCNGVALRRYADLAATLVLIAACGDDQYTMNYTTSEFIVRLEELTFPGGIRHAECTTYRWLHEQLQHDTPDVERPEIWTNRAAAWLHCPFALQTHD
jgi:general stress protein CsbA